MRFMSAWWRAALCALMLTTSGAAAQEQAACEDALDPLLCRVESDINDEFLVYLDHLIAADLVVVPDDRLAIQFMPRLAAAAGDMETLLRWDGQLRALKGGLFIRYAGSSLLSWEAAALTEGIGRSLAESASRTTTPPTEASNWIKAVLAYRLAEAAEAEKASELFAAAADDVLTSCATFEYFCWAGLDRRNLFRAWGASGMANDALLRAADLDAFGSEEALVAIAEGLGLAGDADTVARLIGMSGRVWHDAAPADGIGDADIALDAGRDHYRLRMALALAEAHRRSGGVTAAMAVLEEAHDALGLPQGLFDVTNRSLVARAYILLGDVERGRLMVEDSEQTVNWLVVAPSLACHDLALALELPPRRYGYGDRNPVVTAETLLAAAASGQGEDAYAFALAEPKLSLRLLYLMASATGLHLATAGPQADPGCWSLSMVRP